MSNVNLTYLLSDALQTEWMMTLEACQALKRIYTDALVRKGDVGHLQLADIAELWAKHEAEGLSESMHMLRDEGSSMALQTEPMKGTNYTSVYKNVAVIDIIGPIVPRVRGMSSGSVGAQQIKNDFITAFEDDNIKAILFNVDSPGGDARGISELAQTIKKARDKNTKLIHAYAAGWAASAAYFIISPAHRIVVNDWASVGSIGVVIGVPPKMEGDYIEFVSSNAPDKRPDIETDAGKKVYQDKADYMGDLFAKAVASYRGVTVEKVISDFGRGGTLIGKQAVSGGLGDAVGTFDSALHALVSSKAPEGQVIEKAPEPNDDPLIPCDEPEDSKANVQLQVDGANKSKLQDGDKTMSTNKDDAKTATAESRWDRFTSWLDGEKASAKGDEPTPAGVNIYTMPPPVAGALATFTPAKQPHAFVGEPNGVCTAPDCGEKSDHAAHEEPAEVKALRAQAALAEKYKTQIEALRVAEAEAFAGSLVLAHTIMPAGKDRVAALYLQHARDDEASPLIAGADGVKPASRVEQFKGMFGGVPKHSLTSEFITADMPVGAFALNPDAGSSEEESLKAAEASARDWAAKNNPKPSLVN